MERLILSVTIVLAVLMTLTSVAESQSPVSCCVSYSEKPIPLKIIKDYRIQDTKEYCNINAVLFLTVRGRQICANPKDKWVMTAIQKIK
ncbi:CCL20 protein, partial [Atractosteus spatula]|nr:CCL20 protein [Atractosteus spatula]